MLARATAHNSPRSSNGRTPRFERENDGSIPSLGDTIYVYADFETGSIVKLKTQGTYVYANHPSTHIQCFGFRLHGDTCGRIITDFTVDSDDIKALKALANNPNVVFVFHNAYFDRQIWNRFLVPLGFPVLTIERTKCTMAKTLAFGLPGSLEDAAIALKLINQKDMAGSKVMKKLSAPRRISKKNTELFWTRESAPTAFEQLDKYCLQDIDTTIELNSSVRDLTRRETRIWHIDQRINEQGVYLDLEAINAAKRLEQINKDKLLDEFKSITGLRSPSLRDKYKTWLRQNDCIVPDTRAATLRKVKASAKINRSIEISLELNKTSLRKLDAMLRRCSPEGLLVEIKQYHGAHTGRWAGRGVQLQNLKRTIYDMDMLINHIKTLSYDMFEFLYGDVHEALSVAIRGMIIPALLHKFYIADFAQIEARVLAWLAGDTDKLDIFATGKDPYIIAASIIYGVSLEEVDKLKRLTGKVSELALGYQGGIGAFVVMGSGYDLDLMPVYPIIWASASESEKRKARKSYRFYLAKFLAKQKKSKKFDEDPVTEEVGFTADIIKQRWRIANPKVVQFWEDLNATVLEALRTRKPVKCGVTTWFVDGANLHCKLPSGRIQTYPFAEIVKDEGNNKDTVRYLGKDPKTNKPIIVYMYGGKWAENITQGIARDILSEAMDRLEAEFPVTFDVHDEVINQVPINYGFKEMARFKELILATREWADGLPVDIDVFEAMRYRK